ncbi:MAG: heme ABC transporter ATP-binding protein [Bacteroidota bacterium]
MIEAKRITKFVGTKAILKACSIKVKPGYFTAVVGANGAGKTTLLKSLSGEQTLTSGEIILNDTSIRQYKGIALSKVRAVLSQHTEVNFPFTVEQVIEIGRYPYKTHNTENEKIIQEVIRLTSLQDFIGRPYQTLSGGEKQRVQMARVMAQLYSKTEFPKYLLLDEPTSSLDLAQQHILLALAKNLCKQNIGILAILHDLNLAIQYADEILFLKKGVTVAYGSCQTTATRSIIEDTFSHPVRLLDDGTGRKIVVPRHFNEIHTQNLNPIEYERTN